MRLFQVKGRCLSHEETKLNTALGVQFLTSDKHGKRLPTMEPEVIPMAVGLLIGNLLSKPLIPILFLIAAGVLFGNATWKARQRDKLLAVF